MNYADQIDEVVRRCRTDALLARQRYLQEQRQIAESLKETTTVGRTRSVSRESLTAEADRHGSVMPRVLLAADQADQSPHQREIVESDSAATETPTPPPTEPDGDAEPNYRTGWLRSD